MVGHTADTTGSDVGGQPRITVIIPSYRGEDRILTCLSDLAAQTLPASMFEIVVVQNGPRTRTPEIVRSWSLDRPEMRVRLLETDVASAQGARNLALDGPTAEWITFVDDDDRLQPRFLEALWDAAAQGAAHGTVPFGRVAVALEGRPQELDEDIWLNTVPRRHLGRRSSNADLWPAINPAWAKLVERSAIGDLRFDPNIRYADDTVFWMELLARTGVRLTLTDFRDDSMYVWVQRTGSITRSTADSWTTHVIQKLDAIAELQRAVAPAEDKATHVACGQVCALFWANVVAYVQSRPTEAERVAHEITGRNLSNVPWQQIHAGLGGVWAFLNPRDHEAVRRLRDLDKLTNVIATGPLREEKRFRDALDRIITGISAIPAPQPSWRLVARISAGLRDALIQHPQAVEQLAAIRSDARTPFEHLVAAMLHVLKPDAPWTAHLTGALQEGLGGRRPVEADATLAILTASLALVSPELREVPDDLGGLAEVAIALLADEVVVADDQHRRDFLDRLRAAGLPAGVVDRATARTRIARVPALTSPQR